MIKKCLSTMLLALLLTGVAQAHGTKDKTLISPAELADNPGTYQILDVRSEADFSKGHIPGSLSIPLPEISDNRLKSLSLAQEDNIALYGISESSAKKAKMLLDILGYSRVRILSGGYTHWVEDGQDSEKGAPQPASKTPVTASIPGLEVEPGSYDFGTISQADGVVETSFVVKNISANTISVTEITTSCGCTTAKLEDKTFPPGQARRLVVFFDPNFHKEPEGKFSRTVFLQTSNSHEILAKIEVEIEK